MRILAVPAAPCIKMNNEKIVMCLLIAFVILQCLERTVLATLSTAEMSVPCSRLIHRLHALYDCHSLICFGNSHKVIIFADMHEGFAEKGLPMLW
jgi:hypothetical protein